MEIFKINEIITEFLFLFTKNIKKKKKRESKIVLVSLGFCSVMEGKNLY